MIDSNTAIQYMFADLIAISPGYHPSLKKEFSTRCPWCGDSKKNSKSEHLYIRMTVDDRDNVAYFSYDCKLCRHKSKVMTVYDAKTIGITNSDLLEYLSLLKNKVNNSIKRSGTNIIVEKQKFISDIDLHITNEKYIQNKKEYMYKRIECKDVLNHPEKYKIIYDLKSFFMINKLKPNLDYCNGNINRIKNMLNYYNDNCIGFVSFDNTHINFRDISKNPKQRYWQYMIYPSSQLNKNGTSETSGIYIIPAKINIMAPFIKLIMSEGTFDILNIYTDFYKGKDISNIIFASVSNSHGYAPCITRLLEYGVMLNYIEIYSDDDVEIKEYIDIIKPLVPDTKIIIYYNKASKDVGDKQKPIDLKSIYI